MLEILPCKQTPPNSLLPSIFVPEWTCYQRRVSSTAGIRSSHCNPSMYAGNPRPHWLRTITCLIQVKFASKPLQGCSPSDGASAAPGFLWRSRGLLFSQSRKQADERIGKASHRCGFGNGQLEVRLAACRVGFDLRMRRGARGAGRCGSFGARHRPSRYARRTQNCGKRRAKATRSAAAASPSGRKPTPTLARNSCSA